MENEIVNKNTKPKQVKANPAGSGSEILNLSKNNTSASQTPTATAPIKSEMKSALKPRRRIVSESQSRVQNLFDHLPKSSDRQSLFETSETSASRTQPPPPHPIFYTLGLKYAVGRIQGSNSRCVALLDAIKEYIQSYVTPEGKDFRYAFAQSLKINLNFLRRCRPFAVAMDNAVEFINSKFHGASTEVSSTFDNESLGQGTGQEERSESEIRDDMLQALSDFQDAIEKAKEAIVENSEYKIKSGDTILIYGYSEVVWKALLAAAEHKTFSLVVIESRAMDNEKKGMGLDIIASFVERKLEDSLASVTYTSITGLSNVLQTVTKVFLGAHALLTNGGVLAHVGSSQIALMASAHNIPVLVCCETYKFCDKSPTDSFFHNELALSFGPFQGGGNQRSLAAYGGGDLTDILKDGLEVTGRSTEDNLFTSLQQDGFLITPVIKYDVTPPELVTAVITDVDILPCTSVPVVLRVQENRKHSQK